MLITYRVRLDVPRELVLFVSRRPRDRSVVLGEEERFRREHPGPVLPGWPSYVGLGRGAGNVHDLAAAREMILAVLASYTDEMPALADCGYEVTASSRRRRSRKAPKSWTLTRAPGVCCSALLSRRWKTLQNVTASPSEIGSIARAVLVLTLFEHKRLAESCWENLIVTLVFLIN